MGTKWQKKTLDTEPSFWQLMFSLLRTCAFGKSHFMLRWSNRIWQNSDRLSDFSEVVDAVPTGRAVQHIWCLRSTAWIAAWVPGIRIKKKVCFLSVLPLNFSLLYIRTWYLIGTEWKFCNKTQHVVYLLAFIKTSYFYVNVCPSAQTVPYPLSTKLRFLPLKQGQALRCPVITKHV